MGRIGVRHRGEGMDKRDDGGDGLIRCRDGAAVEMEIGKCGESASDSFRTLEILQAALAKKRGVF